MPDREKKKQHVAHFISYLSFLAIALCYSSLRALETDINRNKEREREAALSHSKLGNGKKTFDGRFSALVLYVWLRAWFCSANRKSLFPITSYLSVYLQQLDG